MFLRYAAFYTPHPDTALAKFGASWLGWDSAAACPEAHPDLSEFDVAALTETPRPYGFHGTLKPPFRLAEGATVEDLEAAFEELARSLAPVSLAQIAVQDLSGFVALCPEGSDSALAALAFCVVQQLDPLRAPLNAAELAKRRRAPLTDRQESYLDAWGYPYVGEEFRYHMTLTGQIGSGQVQTLVAALGPLMAPALPKPFVLDAITLLGQGEDGRFRQIHRYTLTG